MSEEVQPELHELYELTTQIQQQTKTISQNMADNEDHVLLELEKMIDQRDKQLENAKPIFLKRRGHWNERERKLLQQLQTLDQQLQTSLQQVYDQFANQLRRFQQGKHMSQKYHHASQPPSNTDGAFFDKRK
ncbi:hypothetical protein [Caldalkalibacillus salinus]|uniref:hypothetical protein n=1 Tax=Caldalkalibacillus salinus TaxID=2803787 RepID=UPI001922DC30|nr:hypothetical protein [Caldalkalibacillus salinus]